MVSDVNKEVELEQLGDPKEVGQTLIDKVIAPEGSGRSVKLIDANKREASNHIFYDLEYELNLCLLYTSPSPRDRTRSRMPSSA